MVCPKGCVSRSRFSATHRVFLPSIALLAALLPLFTLLAALLPLSFVRAHDIASVQNINNETVSAQLLPPNQIQPLPSFCTVSSDCYSLDPESNCIATIHDVLKGNSSYVTPCSLCSSQYRFGAAPRVCLLSTAICTCASASAGSSLHPDAVSEFSVGLRPHLATLVATSTTELDGRAVACEWQFQTLRGDEENDCRQGQQQQLKHGGSSSTRLTLQIAIDTSALVSLFNIRHPRVLMLMEPGVDEPAAQQGDDGALHCQLCLILLSTVASACVSLHLPMFSNPVEFITASVHFEFPVHWKQLHGQSAQFELVSAGAHTVLLGASHVIILNVPDAINRSQYISLFSSAPSLYHRAVLKSSLVDRLPPPIGDTKFSFPVPPIRKLGDFHVEGIVLPTRRAVAMCIVGETRNFFEDGALTAQLIRDNVGSAVS